MAKQFFYVAAGFFLLVAAYQLGAKRAEADWGGTGFIVGAVAGSYAWNSLGEAYEALPDQWLRKTSWDLPVPTSDIKLLTGHAPGPFMLVTHSDQVWQMPGWGGWGDTWLLLPPIPGGPVSVGQRSFANTKAAYR